MTITDEMVERALLAFYPDMTVEEMWLINGDDVRPSMRAALTAALEGRGEPDVTAAMTITHERAREAARRLIAGAFRRDGERLADDKRPRFSIPTRVEHDDDTVIVTYIEQQQRLATDIARIRSEAVAAERERCARVAEEFGPSRPLAERRPAERVMGRWEGEQAASQAIAAAIRGDANDPR